MTDPIAAGIKPDVSGSLPQPGSGGASGEKFEAAMNEQNEPGAPPGEPASAPPISHDEVVRMERELQTRVLKMERTEQVHYFSKPLEVSYAAYADVRERLGQAPTSPAQHRMLETLDHLGTEYEELSGFLKDFASGKDVSQQERLAVQIRSHQVLQSVEILSKSVEQSTSGMKTIIQTNV